MPLPLLPIGVRLIDLIARIVLALSPNRSDDLSRPHSLWQGEAAIQ